MKVLTHGTIWLSVSHKSSNNLYGTIASIETSHIHVWIVLNYKSYFENLIIDRINFEYLWIVILIREDFHGIYAWKNDFDCIPSLVLCRVCLRKCYLVRLVYGKVGGFLGFYISCSEHFCSCLMKRKDYQTKLKKMRNQYQRYQRCTGYWQEVAYVFYSKNKIRPGCH